MRSSRNSDWSYTRAFGPNILDTYYCNPRSNLRFRGLPCAVALFQGGAQRLRLDRDREASRDLNRLLDKPGPGAQIPSARKYIFGNGPGLK